MEVVRLRAVVLLCVGVMCCTSSPEVVRFDDGAATEVLLQQGLEIGSRVAVKQGVNPDFQPGAEIHPRGKPDKCFTAVGEKVVVAPCAKTPGQQWYYDRLGGGSFQTTTTIKEKDVRVCLTRVDNGLLLRPCSRKEDTFALQKWQLLCGAITSAHAPGRVLEAAGSKVFTSFWLGRDQQLWDFKERVVHEKCSAMPNKVLKFSGSPKTTAVVKSFYAMPSTQLSVSAWVNAKNGTIFSYGTSSDQKVFVWGGKDALAVSINGNTTDTKVAVAGLGWVHLTTTWNSEDGTLVVYINGRQQFRASGIAKGQQFAAGGCLMLGQQQAAGCTASSEASFDGELSDLQVFSTIETPGTIQSLMAQPVSKELLEAGGAGTTSPQPNAEMRLALLHRQFAAQELGVATPAVCDLSAFGPPMRGQIKGVGRETMQFSMTGGGFYKTFSGCHFQTQNLGEWIAVRVKKEFAASGTYPIVQFRTSPKRSNCKWCGNGVVAFVDGCAVKYGKDSASAGFGGFSEGTRYEASSAMNGKSHQGWKYSGSKMMQVNLGTGATHNKHFEALLNDGTYVKCSPRSIIIDLPKKYIGKVNGVAGTGVAGKDWVAGESKNVCAKCKPGKQVAGTNGICHKEFPSALAADPFNGNTFTKPVFNFMGSWQVDGDSYTSSFTYPDNQAAGMFNKELDTATKPALIVGLTNATAVKEASSACAKFSQSPTTLQKCMNDFYMFGAVAVRDTFQDLERVQEASILTPTERSIRDISRYRTKVEWVGKQSWGCTIDLENMVIDQKAQQSQAAQSQEARPIDGTEIVIELDQKRAKSLGLSSSEKSQLNFAEIEVWGGAEMSDRIVPAKMQLLNPAQPTNQYQAMNCVDGNQTTDCRTAPAATASIKFELPIHQEISKIVLVDTQDKKADTDRNVGATVFITKGGKSPAVWRSDPISKLQKRYIFTPRVREQAFNLTKTVQKDFGVWAWSTHTIQLNNGSILVPAGQTIHTRQQLDVTKFNHFSFKMQSEGPGAVKVSMFNSKCTDGEGLGLVMVGKTLSFWQGSQTIPITKQSRVNELHHLAFLASDGIVKVLLDGEEVLTTGLTVVNNGGFCATAAGGPLFIGDAVLRETKPVGEAAVSKEKTEKTELAATFKDKIAQAKKEWNAASVQQAAAKKERAKKSEAADQRAEVKEGKTKVEEKKKAAAQKATDCVACEVNKQAREAREAEQARRDKLLAEKAELADRKKRLDTIIADYTTDLAQQQQNIFSSQKTLDRISKTIGAAQADVTLAFAAAKLSLLTFVATAKQDAKENSEIDQGLSVKEESLTTEHDEYLRRVAILREMHRSRAQAQQLLADSKVERTSLHTKLHKATEREAVLTTEISENNEFLDSLAVEESTEDAAVANDKALMRKKAPKKTPESLTSMATRLRRVRDPDDAFNLEQAIMRKVKKLHKPQSAAAAAKAAKDLAMSEMELAKSQEEVKTLKLGQESRLVKSKQEALRLAKASGNAAKVAELERELKAALTKSPESKAEENKIVALKKLVADAKKTGDKKAENAAEKMLAEARNSMNPSSPDGKVLELKAALRRAMSSCKQDPAADAEVVTIKRALVAAKAQAKAAREGTETDALIAQAAAAAKAKVGAPKKTPALAPGTN